MKKLSFFHTPFFCTHKVVKRFGKCYNVDTAVVSAALQKNAGLRRWRDISPEKRGTL